MRALYKIEFRLNDDGTRMITLYHRRETKWYSIGYYDYVKTFFEKGEDGDLLEIMMGFLREKIKEEKKNSDWLGRKDIILDFSGEQI